MRTKTNILYVFLAFLVIMVSSGCANKAPEEDCYPSKYLLAATPIIEKAANIINSMDINKASDRDQAREKLIILQTDIEKIECKDKYPLKHETLEYSIIHVLNALDYADKNDFENAAQSLKYAEANARRFSDWSVDMGE